MERISKIDQPRTWILDIDGTLLRHGGFLSMDDCVLPNVQQFFKELPSDDVVIITTARDETFRKITEDSLQLFGIRWNVIIFSCTTGERILVNDKKPDGTLTAYAINLDRNKGFYIFD